MAKKTTKAVQQPPAPNLDHIAEQLRPLAVAIEDLTPDPANARKHGADNLTAIKASLRVYGQRKPVVVNKRNGVVEAGNGTLAAAIALKWTHVAAVYVDDDPSTAAGFAIADNRSAELADWDGEALDKLIREIETGDEDLQALLSQLAEEQKLIPRLESGENDPNTEWQGLPEFDNQDMTGIKCIVHFETEGDKLAFENLIGQQIPRNTHAVWYPQKQREDMASFVYGTES